MGINIGNNNKFKNVTIAEKMNGTTEHRAEKKTFAERHPILIVNILVRQSRLSSVE